MTGDAILTIEEVAAYLRVSERTVYDWAQKGEIPAGKIGTVWRFKRAEIERWTNERLGGSDSSAAGRAESSHAGGAAQRGGGKGVLSRSGGIDTPHAEALFSPDRILLLNYPGKRDVLRALSENLACAPQIKNRQELSDEILRREDLMSTAIGRGIAIPHVRLASVTDLVVSVGISSVDILDFQPLDDEPVRLVFMIAAAYNQHAYYLRTLSFFSARLKDRALREGLLAAHSPGDAYRLLLVENGR